MVKFKKGQKLLRFSGYSHGTDKKMACGDVGTVSKNQKYPGIVELKEFPGSIGHDIARLIRIDHFPKRLQRMLINMAKNMDYETTHERYEAIGWFIAGYARGTCMEAKDLDGGHHG